MSLHLQLNPALQYLHTPLKLLCTSDISILEVRYAQDILQARQSKITPTAHSAIQSHYPAVTHCFNTSIHREVADVAELAYTSVQLPGDKSKCHSNHLSPALFRAKLSVPQVL